jgi:hypothetical protein
MTKKENIDEIIYGLKMSGSADFEIDECESFTISRLATKGYVIESINRYIEVANLTEARKAIAKLGVKILWM